MFSLMHVTTEENRLSERLLKLLLILHIELCEMKKS